MALPAHDLPPRLRLHRPPGLAPREAAFLDAVRRAAEAGLGDAHFGIDALAEAVGLGARQLARRLRATTGETPGAYLRRLRLARAAERLRAGAPVAEVVAAVGFASRSQFSRAFREAVGVPPSVWATDSSPLEAPMSEIGTRMSGSGT